MIESPAAPALSTALRVLGTIVFALALPALLVTSGVRNVALSEGFYLSEFAKYRVGAIAGLSDPELQQVAQAFIDYFQAPPQRMDRAVSLPQREGPLFNDRELTHMVDVQALMHRIFQLWTVALVALIVSALVIVLTHIPTGAHALARAGLIGGGLAVVIIGLAALASLVDFSALFMQFHFLSFSNDLWMLDPRRDHLIQLFPLEFFFDAALRIALLTVGLGGLVVAASIAALRLIR